MEKLYIKWHQQFYEKIETSQNLFIFSPLLDECQIISNGQEMCLILPFLHLLTQGSKKGVRKIKTSMHKK